MDEGPGGAPGTLPGSYRACNLTLLRALPHWRAVRWAMALAAVGATAAAALSAARERHCCWGRKKQGLDQRGWLWVCLSFWSAFCLEGLSGGAHSVGTLARRVARRRPAGSQPPAPRMGRRRSTPLLPIVNAVLQV